VDSPVAGGPAEGDVVLGALGGLGERVDCTGLPSFSLEGPLVLWLVEAGALDLFAVDAAVWGHWHFLGRLEAGSLLLGPVEGPQHTLVGRPLRGCVLRRIPLRELYRPAGYDTGSWSYDPGAHEAAYDTGVYQAPHDTGTYDTAPAMSPLEYAFALGVGRTFGILFEAPLGDRPGEARTTSGEGVLWMDVPPGSVAYGAAYSAEAAACLLIDGGLWQRMVDQQQRLQSALDRWIEQLERVHEDRTAAGIKAGEAVRAQADRALIDAIDRSKRPGGSRSTSAAVSTTRAASGS
jgi:hypothetical protein